MEVSRDFDRLLAPYLAALRLDLGEAQLDLLRNHHTLLVQWNQRMNLTSVRDPDEMVKRHFAESLFVASQLHVADLTLADVGSGAGFPGFPIAVVHPTCRVTLIESVGKKASFLKQISRGVPNVRVLGERFEQVSECYDWGVLRAVAVKPLRRHLFRKCKNLAILTGCAEAESLAAEGSITLVPWAPQTVLLLCST
jgi:16S rRNA (guanine527-N7)-methyltransferase